MLTYDEIHEDIEQGYKPEGIQTRVKTEVEEVENSQARNMSIGRKTKELIYVRKSGTGDKR